jgi:hypothetical protein
MQTRGTLICAGLLILVLIIVNGPARAANPQNITIDAGNEIQQINYPFWGVNYVAFWDAIQGSDASRAALRNAGIDVLRFPGGEPANWYDWSHAYDSGDEWSTTDTADLWDYAQGIGAELLLQTNPTTNPTTDDDQPNDPSGSHAADWVRFTNDQGMTARYWEIGNEPDLRMQNANDWQFLNWYFDAFDEQAAAMRAVDPSIKIFGPAGTNAWQWWGLGSLEMFLERAGNRQGSGQVDGVSLHYYPAAGGCRSWNEVRDAGQGWAENMDYIQSAIEKYDSRDLPVFISETNAAVGAMSCADDINQEMGAALANADLFGAYRDSGVQAIQFFGAIHNSKAWGLLYGAEDDQPADTPTPSYFILPIWTQTGDTVLQVSGLSDPSETLSAYASRKHDGSLQVVLINKTAGAIPVNLNFAAFDPAGSTVDIYELRPAGNEGIKAQEVIYNGRRMPDITAANLPAPVSRQVDSGTYSYETAAYSLTLLDFGGSAGTDSDPVNPPVDQPFKAYLPAIVRE